MAGQINLFTGEVEPQPGAGTLTKWVPHAWLDEYAPDPLPDPAGFAEQDADGTWHLRPPVKDSFRDERHDSGLGELLYDLVVRPGDEVRFCPNRAYPDVTLTVRNDGTWTVSPPLPDDANCLYVDGDFDAISDEVETLVAHSAAYGEALEPGAYGLTNYYWGGPVRFRFEVEDGAPRFSRVGVEP